MNDNKNAGGRPLRYKEAMQRFTITLPPHWVPPIRRLGAGNFSLGLRILLEKEVGFLLEDDLHGTHDHELVRVPHPAAHVAEVQDGGGSESETE